MLSTTLLTVAQMQTMDETLLDKVRMAGKEDEEWTRRKEEIATLKAEGKATPKNWELAEGLLYYKDRLYIPAVEELQTKIAQGCHDSKITSHFGQEKTIELVTQNFC